MMPFGLFLDKILFNFALEFLLSIFILTHNLKYKFYPIKSFFVDKIWIIWFLFLLLLTLCGLIFGIPYFNFKLLAALILASTFSSIMYINGELVYVSLKFFALGMSLYALCFYLGIFEGNYYFSKGRLNLFEENPNSLSTRVSLAIYISFFLFIKSEQKIQKFIYIIFLLLLSPFLLLFGSKGSFLIAAISILVYYLMTDAVKFSKKIYSILIASFVFYNFFLIKITESSVGQRIITDGTELGTRNILWEIAYNKIFLNNPLGVGELYYFKLMEMEFGIALDTHNLFLFILVTSGLLGLFFFISPLIIMLIEQFKLFRKNKEPFYFVMLLFLILLMSKTGGILSYLIMWFFISFIHSNLKSQKNA